jgi:hypothetical protein
VIRQFVGHLCRYKATESLANARDVAFANIRSDRDSFEAAVMQAEGSGSVFSQALVTNVRSEFREIEQRLAETNEDEIEELEEKAEQLGRLRAYLYSAEEVKIQGTAAIAEMEDEWHVPSSALRGVNDSLRPLRVSSPAAPTRYGSSGRRPRRTAGPQ